MSNPYPNCSQGKHKWHIIAMEPQLKEKAGAGFYRHGVYIQCSCCSERQIRWHKTPRIAQEFINQMAGRGYLLPQFPH